MIENNLRAIWDAKPYRPDGIVDGRSSSPKSADHNRPMTTTTESKDRQHTWYPTRRACYITQAVEQEVLICRSIAASLLQDGNRVSYGS